jgi:hypothetical protein
MMDDSQCGHHNLHNSCAWQSHTGIKHARVQNIALKHGNKSGDAGNARYDTWKD